VKASANTSVGVLQPTTATSGLPGTGTKCCTTTVAREPPLLEVPASRMPLRRTARPAGRSTRPPSTSSPDPRIRTRRDSRIASGSRSRSNQFSGVARWKPTGTVTAAVTAGASCGGDQASLHAADDLVLGVLVGGRGAGQQLADAVQGVLEAGRGLLPLVPEPL